MIIVLKKKQYLSSFYNDLFVTKNCIVIAHASNIQSLMLLRSQGASVRVLRNNVLKKLGFFFNNVFSGLTIMFILKDFNNLETFLYQHKLVLPLFCKYNNYFFSYNFLQRYNLFFKYSNLYVLKTFYMNYIVLFKYLLANNILNLFCLCRR